MKYAHRSKLSAVLSETYSWILSLLIAWFSSKILLWPILEILLAWIKPRRTDNLSIDEMNLTLFESRIALAGVAFIALVLLATLAIDNQVSVKAKKIAIRTENIALAGYIYYYWLYQSVYWWYSSPISINYYEAGLIRELNTVRAILTFCVLAFTTSQFAFGSNKNGSKRQILKRLIVQISIYLTIWALCFWSSIPNNNLGLPATLVFSSIVISILLYYFWNNSRNNARMKEIA